MFTMRAIIKNFRRGRNRTRSNQLVLDIAKITSARDAYRMIGRKVLITLPAGKKLIGKIISTHGSKGRVRAHFQKGLPGDALGVKAVISD